MTRNLQAETWKSYISPGDGTRRPGLAILCVLLIGFFSVMYDGFLSLSNGTIIAQNIVSLTIAGIGSTILVVSGNIDLSIGGQYAMIAVVTATVGNATQSPLFAIAVAIVTGLVIGTTNGVMVRLLKISPIIVTLGAMFVYGGLSYLISGGVTVGGLPRSLVALGTGTIGPFPGSIIVALLVFVLGAVFLLRTVGGLRLYAIGGDATAAQRNGVKVGRQVIAAYALNGALISIVAILTTARLSSASPQLGTGFELDVLTAVILGGVAFTGGSGHPLGVLIGVATIGVLDAGLVFAGLADWYQQIATGAVLLLALAADQLGAARGARKRIVDSKQKELPEYEDVALEPTAENLSDEGKENLAVVYEQDPVFVCEGLRKSYGGVQALRNGTLSVWPGEVVCVLGDNGAGKSTLMKIISGAVSPDSGSIAFGGNRKVFNSPAAVRSAGIETVYQDLALCPNLGVAHNLILGEEPRRRFLNILSLRDDKTAQFDASERLNELKIKVSNLRTPVRSLSGGQRQAVAIARALHSNVSLVLMDEPTAALGVSQTQNVLSLIRSIAGRGIPVILVTHDIKTVHAVADRVVILRLGEVVHDSRVHDIDEVSLIRLMAGWDAAPGSTATGNRIFAQIQRS